MYAVSEVRCYNFWRKDGPILNKLLANQPLPLELIARLGLEQTEYQLPLFKKQTHAPPKTKHQTSHDYNEFLSIKLIQIR